MIQGFYIGSRFIPYYGFMLCIGLLVSGFVGYCLIRQFKMVFEDLLIIASYALGFGILGAKLLYLYVSRNQIDWNRMLELNYFNSWMSGGFVFYGGLILGLLSLILVWKVHKINVLSYLKVIIPCIPLAHACGRIGCHLASCCYGIPYNGIFHIVYHNSLYAPNNIGLFPVQLLEAILNIILAIVLIIYIIKNGSTIYSIYIYLFSYSILRFGLEFLRYDSIERGKIGFMSTSQIISILLCVGTVTAFVYTKKRK